MACRLVAPSHYLNQCWNIVNFSVRNKLQWNVNQNTYIFSQENIFENAICEMAAILSRPQCIKCRHLNCGKRNVFSSMECAQNNLRNRSKLWPEIWCKFDDVIKWKHFRVTGHLCGEFTNDRWIPSTNASDRETPSRPLWRHCNDDRKTVIAGITILVP